MVVAQVIPPLLRFDRWYPGIGAEGFDASCFVLQSVPSIAGSEGFTAIRHNRISAVLLDYGLQGDGDNVALLCRYLAVCQIPFMFYTGYSELERNYPRAIIVEKLASTEALLAAMTSLIGSAGSQTAA